MSQRFYSPAAGSGSLESQFQIIQFVQFYFTLLDEFENHSRISPVNGSSLFLLYAAI